VSKVIITTATTVDGVADGFEWYVSEGGHDQASRDQFQEGGAMLLGRKTYEGLAGYWPTQEGPWAERINPMPKFVGSRTLQGPLEWNASLLDGDVEEAVPKLKAELEGDLVVSGCGEFARDLIAKGLVDELRFWLHPVVWGKGVRPFEGETVRMRLLDSKTFDSGVTLLSYEPNTTT
jgi:dihydrofolate reductase